jgi:hypothetical protein
MTTTKYAPVYVYHAGCLLITEAVALPSVVRGQTRGVDSEAFRTHVSRVAANALSLARLRESWREAHEGSTAEVEPFRVDCIPSSLGTDFTSYRVFCASEEERADFSESGELPEELSFLLGADFAAEREKGRADFHACLANTIADR